MEFDYKKYSLENLENWVHDAMSSGEATPKEIYNVIVNAVKDNYYIYKKQVSNAYELLTLLNNDTRWTIEEVMKEKEYYEPSMPQWGHSDLEYLSCNGNDKSPECQKAWNSFWEEHYYPEEKNSISEDKVVKWQLPVNVDGLTGECYINLPDDLLERAELKEGDILECIDRKDGSFELKKLTKPLQMNEC